MAESKWMLRVERALGDVAVRCHRRPMVALFVVLALAAVGAVAAQRMRLTAELEKLLPRTFQSVRDLEPVRERFGGIGYVVVVGMGADEATLRRFADDIAPKLEKLPGIRYVDYQRSGRFFEDRSLYYLDLKDVKEVHRRIKAREKWERRQANPMFVQLDDEPAPSLDFSDIEAKYGKRSDQRLAGDGGSYYLDPTKKMVVLLAKPERNAADLFFSEKLVQTVESFLDQQNLQATYGKDFKVGLTGTFKYKVDQQHQLAGDMASASTLAFVILLVYLVFHFRSLFAVGLVLTPVAVGLAWTYGITAAVFGSLNVLTGFLGAILGGLGIEHGIHLFGRYQVLRGEGKDSEAAIRETYEHTGGSALVSSLVASLTFSAIAYSEFRAFREFGIIAAIGMVVVLASYVFTLPAVLGLATRLGWKGGTAFHTVAGEGSELARLLPRYPRWAALGMGLMLAFFIVWMPKVRFDFDFHSLEDSSLPSFELDRETNRILGYSMEPVVILTQDNQSERELVKALKARMKAQGEHSTIDFVAALDDLVPEQQAEKQAVFQELTGVLNRVNEEKLSGDTRSDFERLKRMVQTPPFTREDIPLSVRRQFEGVQAGKQGGFVLIFPNISLSDGMKVRAFAKEVRGLELPSGQSFSAAGEVMVLADILEMVIRESPPILFMAAGLVLLAMWLSLGSLRVALVCISPTILSLLGLIGLMAMLDLPFNYLNILIVPVLIGVTVDAGVHLVQRLSERTSDFTGTYAETGRAICGGLLTSAVGFGALLLADHPGLNSLGVLANLGFALNLLVMLVGFPALLLLLQPKGALNA